jgi:hypothetical protein
MSRDWEEIVAASKKKLAEDEPYWPEYRDRPAVIYDCPPQFLIDWNDGVPPADGEYLDVFVVGLGRMWIRK